jgi:hypothetical protein
MVLPKRSLRNRGSNGIVTTTTDGAGGESEKDNGVAKNDFDGGHDARGKSPPKSRHLFFLTWNLFPPFTLPAEKSKFPLR